MKYYLLKVYEDGGVATYVPYVSAAVRDSVAQTLSKEAFVDIPVIFIRASVEGDGVLDVDCFDAGELL